MIEADLTPRDVHAARRASRLRNGTSVIAGGSLLTAATVIAFCLIDIDGRVTQESPERLAIHAETEKTLATATALEAQARALRDRVMAAETLRARSDWKSLLGYIARGAGNTTTLQSIAVDVVTDDTTQAPAGFDIRVSGSTEDRAELQSLVAWLGKPPLGAEVELGRVGASDARLSFDISAAVRVDAPRASSTQATTSGPSDRQRPINATPLRTASETP